MNKRGLNDVITLVLIIIISLGAIVLVWSFLRPLLQNASESINTEQFSANYEISTSYVYSRTISGKTINITVTKKSNDTSNCYNLILYAIGLSPDLSPSFRSAFS